MLFSDITKIQRCMDVLCLLGLSNCHWNVFNLQELPGSEELPGTD